MKLNKLKKIRVAVSLVIAVLTGALFLDFTGVFSPFWINTVLFVQFIPSLTKFLTVFALSGTGFLVVLLLTLLFGRVYCSSICPLGTLQDVIQFFRRKAGEKNYTQQREYTALSQTLLLLAGILALGGSLLVLNLIDPFSSFGRIVSNLAQPILVAANNGIAFALEAVGVYALDPVPPRTIAPAPIAVTIAVFGVIFWMSFKHGRLYCNTVCPVGALLGLLSRVSLYKIAINQEDCIGCSLCEQACKAGCIDRKAKTVDFTRCVSCYNCFSACPTDSLEFRRAFSGGAPTVQKGTDNSRREALYNSALLVIGVFGTTTVRTKKIISTKDSTVIVVRKDPVSPPGSGTIARFTSRCTACHLCVSACPSQVLIPSLFEYGFAGALQPRLDYRRGFCNYECTTCTEICPSGAILPLAQEQKKLTQFGSAKFVKDNCIVFTEEKECGACSEHCPTKAVRMVPYKTLVAPEVKDEYCIGCGACEYACPTKPYKAIYVDGKPVHGLARKPEVKKLDMKVPENFPF